MEPFRVDLFSEVPRDPRPLRHAELTGGPSTPDPYGVLWMAMRMLQLFSRRDGRRRGHAGADGTFGDNASVGSILGQIDQPCRRGASRFVAEVGTKPTLPRARVIVQFPVETPQI
jgi:hypothetical protein